MVVKAMKIINLCSLNSQWCPFCILIKACPPWGLGHPNRQSPDLQGWKIPSSSGDYWENGKMSHSFAYMLSCFSWVWIFVTLWSHLWVTHDPPWFSVQGFSRQEYWSDLTCPPPGDLPDPGIKPVSPVLQVHALQLSQGYAWVTPTCTYPSPANTI